MTTSWQTCRFWMKQTEKQNQKPFSLGSGSVPDFSGMDYLHPTFVGNFNRPPKCTSQGDVRRVYAAELNGVAGLIYDPPTVTCSVEIICETQPELKVQRDYDFVVTEKCKDASEDFPKKAVGRCCVIKVGPLQDVGAGNFIFTIVFNITEIDPPNSLSC